MKKIILVLILFIFLTIIETFPLALNIKTHIPGTFHTSESLSTIWKGWQLKYTYLNKININKYQFISYPFGLPQANVINFPMGIFVIKWLSILTNEVAMYNIIILNSFILSGLFTFILMYYLTKNPYASVFTAVAFAFCPYHFVKSWQYLGLSEIQWIPLYLYALFKLKHEIRIKNSIFLALVLFLFSENYTYVYFSLIATLPFLFLLLIDKNYGKKKDFLKFILLSGLLVFLATLPNNLIIYKNLLFGPPKAAIGLFHRPFEDLFAQSAKPLSYFLPSATHPVLGWISQIAIGSLLYGTNFTEHTLYLGWTIIILSVMAFFDWRKHRKIVEENYSFNVKYFTLLAALGWLFSQPPWWNFWSLKMLMPSFFIYRILPMFRAYSRFGVVVMLACAILGGFALISISRRLKSREAKFAVFLLFSLLNVFEFWNYPPFRIIDISRTPKAYLWLKQQPSDIVIAEYPLDTNGQNAKYELYQTKHEKRMINGTAQGSYANKVEKTIEKLSDPHTSGVLKWMGVKYVLVHKAAYMNSDLLSEIEELNNIPKNYGIKFLKNFDDIDIYEVVAKPLRPEPGN